MKGGGGCTVHNRGGTFRSSISSSFFLSSLNQNSKSKHKTDVENFATRSTPPPMPPASRPAPRAKLERPSEAARTKKIGSSPCPLRASSSSSSASSSPCGRGLLPFLLPPPPPPKKRLRVGRRRRAWSCPRSGALNERHLNKTTEVAFDIFI